MGIKNDILNQIADLEDALDAYRETRADLLERLEAVNGEIEEIEYQLEGLEEQSPDDWEGDDTTR